MGVLPQMMNNVTNNRTKVERASPPPARALIPVKPRALFQAFAGPEGKVLLLYGDPLIFRLSLLMAGSALAHDATIALVDGCNRFDIHTIIRFAQEKRRPPDAFLER